MHCTIFITLMTGGWVDKIIAWLFRCGFRVAPTTPDGYLMSSPNSPSALLSFNVYNVMLDKQDLLRDQIKKFLNENNINYYSIVIAAYQNGTTRICLGWIQYRFKQS